MKLDTFTRNNIKLHNSENVCLDVLDKELVIKSDSNSTTDAVLILEDKKNDYEIAELKCETS